MILKVMLWKGKMLLLASKMRRIFHFYSSNIRVIWELIPDFREPFPKANCDMGATESSYRKLGATVAKLQCVPRKKIEVDETDRVSDRKGKKRRRESLFANAQWSSSGSRRRGSDVSEWPAWYHGWCRRADVETLLKCGPDGLFLVKNSTEFPGDLTLCLFKGGVVEYFRVRRCEVGRNRVTLDNETFFTDVETLIEQYKKEQGNLPCKLAIACARPLSEAELQEVLGKQKIKHSTRRRKGRVNVDEMLIINRE